MARGRLNGSEREFLSRVAETIYTNPFTVRREDIAARFAATDRGGDHHFSAIAAPLETVLSTLEARHITRLEHLEGSDRELLSHAFLFRAYHHCVDRLDGLIEAQLRQPDRPVPVPFAMEVIGELTSRGFSEPEATRYFGLFFQLRRAFYFIDRALVGPGPSMATLRRALWNCVFTEDARVYDSFLWNRMEEFSTLLLGETGTGKGAAAAAIGRSGFIPFDPQSGSFRESFTRTFIATNLSQFPETLIESELFGHRKGAFTGAVESHRGLFERCSPHGSLFLDEIGETSAAVQTKLLKVLQERLFTPVGSHEEKRFSGRVIAATNRTLAELRGDGFRDDLFYRLSSQVVTVPPLRQRLAESAEELPQLVALLIERTVGAPQPELASQTLGIIERDVPAGYPWPGNVRELEQVVRRVLLEQRCPPDYQPVADTLAAELEVGSVTAQELLHRYCQMLYQRFGTYEAVAKHTGLDRRTAKKYVEGVKREAIRGGD